MDMSNRQRLMYTQTLTSFRHIYLSYDSTVMSTVRSQMVIELRDWW